MRKDGRVLTECARRRPPRDERAGCAGDPTVEGGRSAVVRRARPRSSPVLRDGEATRSWTAYRPALVAGLAVRLDVSQLCGVVGRTRSSARSRDGTRAQSARRWRVSTSTERAFAVSKRVMGRCACIIGWLGRDGGSQAPSSRDVEGWARQRRARQIRRWECSGGDS
ncbi:hypothetical protein BC628DRAFT_32525 [Trametes gibbosa]|nr:hypothetical protein BC628DRAFT_32525 [Trametes gibbosa]